MTNNAHHSMLICGLPNSGKTTFLGALSYLLNSQEIKTVLTHSGLSAERQHMNLLSKAWLECTPMSRTPTMQNGHIELNLSDQEKQYSLLFPDLSGETWSALWTSHHCPDDLSELILNASATMLFIHADEMRKAITVVEAEALRQAIEQGDAEEQRETEEQEWDPTRHSSTQAQLVALLQMIKHIRKYRSKLTIVISAWDKVTAYETPNEFIENELPLLHQYLEGRVDYFSWRAYGVSAQGGDLRTEKDRLLNMDTPSERILIQSDPYNGSDLTEIIKWASF
jgi:hypothetical protein